YQPPRAGPGRSGRSVPPQKLTQIVYPAATIGSTSAGRLPTLHGVSPLRIRHVNRSDRFRRPRATLVVLVTLAAIAAVALAEPGTTGDVAASSAGSSNPSSVPIPLIVLAGLAGVLLLAGGAGYVARRVQGKRGGPPSDTP